jgi:hypothetical protein
VDPPVPVAIDGEGGMGSDVFFSYNRRDAEVAEVVARTLRDHGLKVFLDRWSLVPGLAWPQVLERAIQGTRAVAVLVGHEGFGSWQNREQFLAVERQNREPSFRVIPVLLPGAGADPPLGLLRQNTWVDLRPGLDNTRAIDILIAGIRGEPPNAELQEHIADTRSKICPYRGLRAFREEDAAYFFGRSVYTGRLIEAVGGRTLVAVLGASGSGKSSVVRAGLLPYLRRAESGRWEITTLTPGREPLRALAARLIPLLEPSMTEADRLAEIGKLHKSLLEGDVRLEDVARRVLEKQRGSDRILLVVDQWEELYTQSDERERSRFVDGLVAATSGDEASLSTVLTMRGDFVDRALAHRGLADRLQTGTVVLGPMTADELREAVSEPAEREGLRFQPGLLARVVNDAGQEPGSLPLLEFVLAGLWEQRTGGELTHDIYEKMGGIAGAIATKAEEVYGAMTLAEQAQTKQVFLRLVQAGEGAKSTRKRAAESELPGESLGVVEKLVSARLAVKGHDDARAEDTVDVAHEALIRKWPRLQAWVDDDREFLLWRERLRAHRTEWEAQHRDDGALLRGAPLAEAKSKLEARRKDLGDQDTDYIVESARVARLQRLSARTLSAMKGLALVTGSIVGSGYVAEKAYLRLLGVRSEVSLQSSLKTGVSFLANSMISAIPGLFMVGTLALLFFGVVSLLNRELRFRSMGGAVRELLDRPLVLLASQFITSVLLARALFAMFPVAFPLRFVAMETPGVSLEDVTAIAAAAREHDFVIQAASLGVLALIVLERWRLRAVQQGVPARTEAFVLSLAMYAVVLAQVLCAAVEHGFNQVPIYRDAKLVEVKVREDGSRNELRGKTLHLIRDAFDPPKDWPLYCGLDGTSWDEVDLAASKVLQSGNVIGLLRNQLRTGESCQAPPP